MSRLWELVETLRTWRIDNDAVIHPVLPSTPIITVLPIVNDPEKNIICNDENESKRLEENEEADGVLVSVI